MTVTVNGMLSPKANVPPSTGTLTVTVGAVLPTVIVVFADADFPLESITVSFAVNCPAVVYGERRVGVDRVDRAVAVEVPLEADRVARVGVVRARAREVDRQRQRARWSGWPSATATGARRPLTYSQRIIPASGLMAKKPSP